MRSGLLAQETDAARTRNGGEGVRSRVEGSLGDSGKVRAQQEREIERAAREGIDTVEARTLQNRLAAALVLENLVVSRNSHPLRSSPRSTGSASAPRPPSSLLSKSMALPPQVSVPPTILATDSSSRGGGGGAGGAVADGLQDALRDSEVLDQLWRQQRREAVCGCVGVGVGVGMGMGVGVGMGVGLGVAVWVCAGVCVCIYIYIGQGDVGGAAAATEADGGGGGLEVPARTRAHETGPHRADAVLFEHIHVRVSFIHVQAPLPIHPRLRRPGPKSGRYIYVCIYMYVYVHTHTHTHTHSLTHSLTHRRPPRPKSSRKYHVIAAQASRSRE